MMADLDRWLDKQSAPPAKQAAVVRVLFRAR